MNKSELIEHIAKQADISKAAATRALEALIGGVKSTLKKNNSVSLVGFGTFSVTNRAARSGRNPRTGATIKIKAAKVPKFRAGKALKDAIDAATTKWMGWTIGRQTSKDYGIPRGLPYLTGFVIHCGLVEEQEAA